LVVVGRTSVTIFSIVKLAWAKLLDMNGYQSRNLRLHRHDLSACVLYIFLPLRISISTSTSNQSVIINTCNLTLIPTFLLIIPMIFKSYRTIVGIFSVVSSSFHFIQSNSTRRQSLLSLLYYMCLFIFCYAERVLSMRCLIVWFIPCLEVHNSNLIRLPNLSLPEW